MKTLQELTRPNIWRLKPYSSARDEYSGAAASVFLDANENPYNLPHNLRAYCDLSGYHRT
jgi:histidinol-phosphate aminotransferase